MKINDQVYKEIAEEYSVPWQVVRQIMESCGRMIRAEISSDDSWGCIQIPGIGKFDTKNKVKKIHPSNANKVSQNMKQYGRGKSKKAKKSRALQDALYERKRLGQKLG